DAARRARVPVAVHLDHSYRFDTLMQALRAGFGSVMYDGSRETHEHNIINSTKIAEIAHAMGAGVECELGRVGGLSDETGSEDTTEYTDPLMAKDFVDRTGADFLAVSIGTAHGVYKSTPKLDFERLKAIRKTVDAPLVLHGGSGLSDDDFRLTVAHGIAKVNVYTDVILAAKRALSGHPDASYTDALQLAEAAMKQATLKKLNLFGSAGKA
ncbi:MAG: class II fructose-bisphosphate aldolase, partial [Eubacteriales bacterium]|nr:class II fructose-bisphosphate aldolase [Eubacteriales bacterium]